MFLEICYLNRIKPHEAKDYEIFLHKRIVDIEETITSHFRLLYETLESKYKEEYKKQRKKKEAIQVLTLQQQWKLEQEDEKALKNHPGMKFDDPKIYTPEKKLKLLIEYEEQLLRADRNRRENRRGVQEICRMTSMSQSYFIFDSHEYKVARKIYYDLDKHDQYANEDEDFMKQMESNDNSGKEADQKDDEEKSQDSANGDEDT